MNAEDIEKAIRETLVVENKESIGHAVNKIMAIKYPLNELRKLFDKKWEQTFRWMPTEPADIFNWFGPHLKEPANDLPKETYLKSLIEKIELLGWSVKVKVRYDMSDDKIHVGLETRHPSDTKHYYTAISKVDNDTELTPAIIGHLETMLNHIDYIDE